MGERERADRVQAPGRYVGQDPGCLFRPRHADRRLSGCHDFQETEKALGRVLAEVLLRTEHGRDNELANRLNELLSELDEGQYVRLLLSFEDASLGNLPWELTCWETARGRHLDHRSLGHGQDPARARHCPNSPRARGPFVELNCAALPETLIESELFGAVRGAHSTARERIQGKVEAAQGGTLFLDEIAELTPGAQAKLLQLLQSRTYYPLGASKPLQADVRILSATNADLEDMVAQRRFREDLYYRLRVLPICMPSLAERREDIPLLVEHIAAVACRRYGFPAMTVARAALVACQEAPWAGNVRELAHAVEAAVIRAHGEGLQSLCTEHLFPGRPDRRKDVAESFQEATRRFQASYLQAALDRNEWNIAETSRQLDLARSHIYNLIRGYSLSRRAG